VRKQVKKAEEPKGGDTYQRKQLEEDEIAAINEGVFFFK
jgi:hypothetical protein